MISINKINPLDSSFGQSFNTNIGDTDFFKIMHFNDCVGEVEFMKSKSEIMSIFIDNSVRGKGVGREVVNKLFDEYKIDKIFAWSAKSSLPFWSKISTRKINKDHFIIEKNK